MLNFSLRGKSRRTFLRRMIIPLGALLLLPLLLYTALEFSRLNEQEALLQDLYQSQLGAILFSVNQYCWDVVSGWGNFLHQTTRNVHNTAEIEAQLAQVRTRYDAVLAAFVLRQERLMLSLPDSLQSQAVQFSERILALMASESEAIERMKGLAAKGYFRPLALRLENAGSESEDLLMLFAHEAQIPGNEYQLSGLLLSTEHFVQTVLHPKVSEFESQNFLLAIKRVASGKIFFATQEAANVLYEHEEPLWVLPNMVLAIKLSGASTTEIVRARTKRTLYLLAGVDMMIVLAVALFMRMLSRESQLARLKSDFVDNVSHDLRTPLGLIRMYAETLQMGRVPAEQKKQEYYGILAREAERLTRMVNNLLDFSRIEAGRKVYEQKAVDLTVVLAEVLASYHYHLQQRGFVLEERISVTLPLIQADAEAVSQAVVNLLDNAIKYSETQKCILVALAREGNWIVLEVTDHGVGIAPQHQQKIFDKFYRVEEVGGDTRGAGIGLALVQHVMAAHGGKVEVKSVLGKGSSFYLKFPLHAI